MTTARSGIPTTYRYSNMRSRLEARWAAFFDLVGWSWVYEPFDAAGWIPDFLLQGPQAVLVEVGNCIDLADYEAKAIKASRCAAEVRRDVLVLGITPLPRLLSRGDWSYPVLGWLGEFGEWPDQEPPYATHAEFAWGTAIWSPNRARQSYCFYHEFQSYHHRPGSPDHDPEDREGVIYQGDEEHIARLWAEAGNEVQWRRP